MAWYDGAVNFVKGAANGIKEGACDLAAVGAQVAKGVVDTGASILKGAGTALTDPGKFASDVGQNLSTWGGHIRNSWQSGTSMIKEGWDDVQKGGSPGLLFIKTMGGFAQMASFGASDAIGEHFAASVEAQTDEFGNISGYTAKEGTDAITRVLTKHFGSTVATTKNANAEIEEALDAGDAKTANKIFGDAAWVTIGRPVSKVAGVAGMVAGVAAIPFTGGTSAALTAASAGLIFTSVTTDLVSKSKEATFDAFNAADDAYDAAKAEADALMASGKLGEADLDKYVRIVQAVNANQTYKSMDPDYAQNAGFEDANALKAFLLDANGLPSDLYRSEAAYDPKEQYRLLAESGQISGATAQNMCDAYDAYESGAITGRELSEIYYAGFCDKLDMTQEQKMAYARHTADLNEGLIDEDAYYRNICADPELSGFVQEDGTFFVPALDADGQPGTIRAADFGSGLSDAVSEHDGTEAVPAAAAQEQPCTASENQAIMQEALAQMGYAY